MIHRALDAALFIFKKTVKRRYQWLDNKGRRHTLHFHTKYCDNIGQGKLYKKGNARNVFKDLILVGQCNRVIKKDQIV